MVKGNGKRYEVKGKKVEGKKKNEKEQDSVLCYTSKCPYECPLSVGMLT